MLLRVALVAIAAGRLFQLQRAPAASPTVSLPSALRPPPGADSERGLPFFGTRRPDTYAALTEAIKNPRQPSGAGADGGIPGLNP